MGIFSTQEVAELENKLDNAKAGHRLEKGKLKKEIRRLESKVSALESEVEDREVQIESLDKKVEVYVGLERDEEFIMSEKKRLKNEKEMLEQDLTLLHAREERLAEKQLALEEEENYQQRRGYSDGLADGLRKAHEITAEDRKMLATIALATNQSEAIKQAKLISRQLEAPDEKSKKS